MLLIWQDCSRAHFLLCQHSRGGVGNFGSKSIALASCLGRALQLRAVAIQATANMGVGILSEQLAPFQPWSNCTLQDAQAARATDPSRVTVADFKRFPVAHEDSVNGVRKMSFDSLPTRWRRRGRVWWKAVELSFMLRPTPETRSVLEAARAAVNWPAAGGPRMHTMHIRRGDKIGTEGHYYPFMYFVEALALMNEPGPADREPKVDLFVATDAAQQVSMEMEPYANVQARFFPQEVLEQYTGPAPKHDLAVALDILMLSSGWSYTFTGSSNFGVVALYLNLLKRDFCLNFTTLDVWHPFWWGDDTLHHGHALEVYQRMPDLRPSAAEKLVYSNIKLWQGSSDRFIGMGRGSYNPVIDVEYDMSVYYQAQYAQGIQTFLCHCPIT